jgi:acyl-CoA synthetase (AMP-forming)/AMP-acid ligase II
VTVAELIGDHDPSSPAIIATSPLVVVRYASLAEQIERLAAQFIAAGVNSGDCVAIVLPNGVEFLVALLALNRARIIAAPLNPSYTRDEMGFFLEDTGARAVVTVGNNLAARSAAVARGLPLWLPNLDALGVVTMPQLSTAKASADAPYPDDVALFSYTSGTTSRPKCVPLTHANVVWSSRNIASSYELSPADRSLVVLPMFHGHGLIGAALSTLASGGAVIVPPRFSASAFWTSFREHEATWYSAVPTIHEILLERADSDVAPSSGPRFIRSCSGALSADTDARLERRFGAPVL